MSNAIASRHNPSHSLAALFRAIVKDCSECGCLDCVIETIETEANYETDQARKDVYSAALNFVHCFDFLAVEDLMGSLPSATAERLVRTLRINVQDNPHMWNLPLR